MIRINYYSGYLLYTVDVTKIQMRRIYRNGQINIANDINGKLNFLLEDHGVTFDDSNMAVDSLDTFHKEADAC